jgi:hypothetical protein
MTEQHECYLCGVISPAMIPTVTAQAEDDGVDTILWWCQDATWCRARIAADKLERDGYLTKVALS